MKEIAATRRICCEKQWLRKQVRSSTIPTQASGHINKSHHHPYQHTSIPPAYTHLLLLSFIKPAKHASAICPKKRFQRDSPIPKKGDRGNIISTGPLPETNREREAGNPFMAANSQFTVRVYGNGLRESQAITGVCSRKRRAFCRTIPNRRPLGRLSGLEIY